MILAKFNVIMLHCEDNRLCISALSKCAVVNHLLYSIKFEGDLQFFHIKISELALLQTNSRKLKKDKREVDTLHEQTYWLRKPILF